jgi:hypothetical protein
VRNFILHLDIDCFPHFRRIPAIVEASPKLCGIQHSALLRVNRDAKAEKKCGEIQRATHDSSPLQVGAELAEFGRFPN